MERHGWDAFFAERFAAHEASGIEPGRVARQLRGVYTLWTREEPCDAVAKRSLGRAEAGFPVVGDWVAFAPPGQGSETGQIRAVVERRTKLSRKAAGESTEEQVVAANVDSVFLLTGLDGDFSVRRIERFLVAVLESGAEPVVVLNKTDLVDDTDDYLAEARAVSPAIEVRALSAKTGSHVEDLEPWLGAGKTVALLGSSGVGKSTLVNSLVGETVMETRPVRASDDRGQHTTSYRQLVRTPGGAILIDNPGVREMQVWSAETGEAEAFKDVEEAAGECRFRNCSHSNEPGCGVLAAVADERLSAARVESYLKLRDEQRALDEKKAERAQMQETYRRKVRPRR